MMSDASQQLSTKGEEGKKSNANMEQKLRRQSSLCLSRDTDSCQEKTQAKEAQSVGAIKSDIARLVVVGGERKKDRGTALPVCNPFFLLQ